VERVLYAPRELPPLPPDVAHDAGAYGEWALARERERSAKTDTRHPALALLMILEEPHDGLLDVTLGSLRRQTSRRWTLTIATPATGVVDALVRSCLPHRLRRKVRTMSPSPGAPVVDLVRHASGTVGDGPVALIFPGDGWASDAVALLGGATSPRSVVYADEDALTGSGLYGAPCFKPDYSPDFLLSSAYVGRPIVLGSAVAGALPDSIAHDSGSVEDECALAATEAADSVVHVAEVLVHRCETDGATRTDRVEKLSAARRRRSEQAGVVVGRAPGTLQILRSPSRQRVSIVVPFRDEARLLRACVDSVTATTEGHDVELLLIDNGSTDLEVLTLLDRLQARSDVRVLSDPRPFNWAQLNNAGAGVAHGDVLVFLNNDIEARRGGWLDALIGHALRPDVGAVGARLLYPDGRLQHCGVVIGLIGAAGHPLLGLAAAEPGYMNMALATRECAAVTGACLATRRQVFEHLDGFDESLGVDLNDVDFCLRAGAAGLRTIYEPAAELIHHESPSRGTAGGTQDIVHFIERWKDYIARGDPYFNPHLSRSSFACTLASSGERDRWNQWYSTLVAR
jgi:GT2 family glycosyltransferase